MDGQGCARSDPELNYRADILMAHMQSGGQHHLLVTYFTIPGDCIDRVTAQNGDRVLFERLATPRPAPKTFVIVKNEVVKEELTDTKTKAIERIKIGSNKICVYRGDLAKEKMVFSQESSQAVFEMGNVDLIELKTSMIRCPSCLHRGVSTKMSKRQLYDKDQMQRKHSLICTRMWSFCDPKVERQRLRNQLKGILSG